MNPIIYRMLVGAGGRPTRFHDEKGNRVPFSGLWYAPHSLVTTALNKFFNYHPPMPWLSYRAQREIARIIQVDWVVLEFGSGMSTAWLAKRCGHMHSIEHNPEWFREVQAQMAAQQLKNTHYNLRDKSNYADLSMFPDQYFDFILVDGILRTACIRSVAPKLRKGGWIYLDNTDRNAQVKPMSDYQQAENALLEIVRACQGEVRYFTDFVPTNFIAKQGMLAHL